MIYCGNCGKPIEKVPAWLEGTKVTFVCNNCPNRQAKNIAFVSLDTAPSRLDEDEAIDVEELPEEEEA